MKLTISTISTLIWCIGWLKWIKWYKRKNSLEVFTWPKQFCTHQDIFGGNKQKVLFLEMSIISNSKIIDRSKSAVAIYFSFLWKAIKFSKEKLLPEKSCSSTLLSSFFCYVVLKEKWPCQSFLSKILLDTKFVDYVWISSLFLEAST